MTAIEEGCLFNVFRTQSRILRSEPKKCITVVQHLFSYLSFTSQILVTAQFYTRNTFFNGLLKRNVRAWSFCRYARTYTPLANAAQTSPGNPRRHANHPRTVRERTPNWSQFEWKLDRVCINSLPTLGATVKEISPSSSPHLCLIRFEDAGDAAPSRKETSHVLVRL